MGIVIMVCSLPGCGIRGAPSENQEIKPDDILQAWKELPKAGLENMDTTSAAILAQQLSRTGPNGLKPLIDIIGDPASTPEAKVLAVISLTPLVDSGMAPRLMEMTAPGLDPTTRSCAAHLLGLLESPEITARLRALCDDEEQQVRTAATIVLVMRQDPEILDRIPEIWHSPETTMKQREDLAYMLPESFAATHPELMGAIATDLDLASGARQRALMFLGRFGTKSDILTLQTCATTDPDPALRALALDAIGAIEERAAGKP